MHAYSMDMSEPISAIMLTFVNVVWCTPSAMQHLTLATSKAKQAGSGLWKLAVHGLVGSCARYCVTVFATFDMACRYSKGLAVIEQPVFLLLLPIWTHEAEPRCRRRKHAIMLAPSPTRKRGLAVEC